MLNAFKQCFISFSQQINSGGGVYCTYFTDKKVQLIYEVVEAVLEPVCLTLTTTPSHLLPLSVCFRRPGDPGSGSQLHSSGEHTPFQL